MKLSTKLLLRYIKNILIAIDQLFNALLFGDPDETISSRLGKYYKNSWAYRVLNRLEQNHCEKSIENDEGTDGIFK